MMDCLVEEPAERKAYEVLLFARREVWKKEDGSMGWISSIFPIVKFRILLFKTISKA